MLASPIDNEFLQIVSHDLQSPMRHIVLLAQLLKAGGTKFKKSDLENIKLMEESAQHASRMVSGLITYLRDTAEEAKQSGGDEFVGSGSHRRLKFDFEENQNCCDRSEIAEAHSQIQSVAPAFPSSFDPCHNPSRAQEFKNPNLG